MSLRPGSKLGPYEVVASAGAGGMGEVYRARDSRLNREVAIKVLPAQFSRDADRVSRFRQEAQAAAALNHPNILAIHDFGEHDGSVYIVAEMLEGETLRERLRSGAVPTRKAVDYAQQIARGLSAAHEKGIVHRDLKPENIFVTRDGRVKILDFGLAKLTRPEGVPPTDAATLASQTEPGVVMGTVGYMSPEQVRGQNADARSDLFSFGAILYEMLSGRRAFHGQSSVETMSAILKEEPPDLSETNRIVPPTMERIVRHCLEKNREERFQSAHDVAFALQDVSGSTSQAAAVAVSGTTRSSIRVAALGVVAAAALAAAFSAGWWFRSTPSPSYRPLTFRRGTVTSAHFAPDGQNIIYSAAWEGVRHPELFTMRVDGVLSRALGISDADVVAISAQGEMALLQNWRRNWGWQRMGMLSRMPLGGGAPKEVLDGVQDADWARDGTRMAVVRGGNVYRLEFPLGHVLASTSTGWYSEPKVSPDQQQVAFCEHPPGDSRGSVSVMDMAGHKRVLSEGWSDVQGLAWSASGRELWFTASNTGTRRGLYAVTLSGKLRTVLNVPGSLMLFDVGADGRVLLAQDDFRRFMAGLTPGSSEERDLSWLDWSNARDLSPDGQWLLFDEQGDGGGPAYSLYVRKTDGSPAVRLGDGDSVSLSDDGKWVLATTYAEGGSLALVPTGAGEPRIINTGNLKDVFGRFLPDGKHILVFAQDGRTYVQTLEDGNPRPILPAGVNASFGIISADGKYLIAEDEAHKWALYPTSGGTPVPLPKWTAGDVPINHTTDNHSFFVQNGEIPLNIFRFDFLSGSRQFVRQIKPADATGSERLTQVLMTPDGKYYVYTGARRLSTLFLVSGLK